MSAEHEARGSAEIERIPIPPQSTLVSDELGRLTGILREIFPRGAAISFEYDGALRLHVDVRDFEETTMIAALLPSLCGGIFHDAKRGLTANRSYRHRISALVSR